MIRPIVILLAFSLAPVSFANTRVGPKTDHHNLAAKCPEVNLTPTQVEKITALKKETHLKIKADRAKVKEAKEALMATLADPSSNQALISTKEVAVKQAVVNVIDTLFATSDDIFLSILTKEQRAAGVTCMEKIKKEMKKEHLARECKGLPPSNEDEMDSAAE